MLVDAAEATIVLPETVQGIIAARLDTLPREEKELLQDAAVVGRVVLARRARPRALDARGAAALARAQGVRAARAAQLGRRRGRVRVPACARARRRVRADPASRSARSKHRPAAEWIESLGRPEDHAEMLAHHYACRPRLRARDGPGRRRRSPSGRGSRSERRAIARSRSTPSRGGALLRRSPSSSGRKTTSRPSSSCGYARAFRVMRGRAREQRRSRTPRDALLAGGAARAAAEADALLAEALRGSAATATRATATSNARCDLVRDAPASPAKARVLSQSLALPDARRARTRRRFAIGEEALAMADGSGSTSSRPSALVNIGTRRANMGSTPTARSRTSSGASSSPAPWARPRRRAPSNNLGSVRSGSRRPPPRHGGSSTRRSASASDSGSPHAAVLARAAPALAALLRDGRWDEALPLAESSSADCEAGERELPRGWHARYGARGSASRGTTSTAQLELTMRDEPSRLGGRRATPQARVPRARRAVRFSSPSSDATGRGAAARGELRRRGGGRVDRWTSSISRSVAEELGCVDELRRRRARRAPSHVARRRPCRARGDVRRAADVLARDRRTSRGVRARLRAASALVAEGRRPKADEQLQAALAFYRSVGATRYIRRGEALLATSLRDSRVAPARARSPRRAP